MRLLRYWQDGRIENGLHFKEGVLPLAAVVPEAVSWPQVISALMDVAVRQQIAERATQMDEVIAVDPLPYAIPAEPNSKILCVGLNYQAHAAEGRQAVPEHPVFFIRYLSSFVAHGQAVVRPKVSSQFDYEGELAVVVGKPLRHVSPPQALKGILGYTLAMDGSVRDYQKRTPQWTLGKNFDASGALGPEITLADTLPEGARGLRLITELNGQCVQDGNIADLIYPVGYLLSVLSEVMQLNPGDVVLTGTPEGVGFARTPPLWLSEGDRLRIRCDGLMPLVLDVVKES